ncbi:MAG: hypothetical protein KBS80_08575 [Bacteroidales bacterium]|nr:hypothetical protein [Candidatus Cryptobacteroides choladohippi]
MWNFVGRQNEVHSPTPGDIFHGNWESGIKFLDALRLGDQSDAPSCLADNKGKNHYFFLPLLLGLLGLFFQFDRDKRGSWLTFLMFFMTGIAIVIYLNQPPFQVRERDYAYAGSFYFFSAWVGLGVMAVIRALDKVLKGKGGVALAVAASAACMLVPVQMAGQNWDDHDRSNRRTAVEMATNYLNSVPENGILITHGDNDTFPLWYAQEVENVRTDVRICNTSLLGTDWHIDQMTWACNESAPLNITVPHVQYLYGTNEYVPIYDVREDVMDIKDVMLLFKHPDVKAPMSSGRKVDYIASRRIRMAVNKENCVKYGIVSEKDAAMIPDSITLRISDDKEYLSKPEIFMLDLLSNYEWDRPLVLLSMGGDINIGIKEYLEHQGYSFKFTPIKSKTSTSAAGYVDTDNLYRLMTEVYKFDAVSADNYFIDYQNLYTHLGVMSLRSLFYMAAECFMKHGEDGRALEMLDRGVEVMKNYPIETVPLGFSGNDFIVIEMIEDYYKLGQADKAGKLAEQLAAELLQAAKFYIEFYEYASSDFEMTGNYIYYLADTVKAGGDGELSDRLTQSLTQLIEIASKIGD